ncbi:hypothetical protein SK128_015988 [Halocaridina rubra]|uniref:AAA+ ATPase domain-containing protein n=1 Tax=Halocaridina rubra TaxID=373956 RepID=A0AAN9A1V5_HALRR
MSLSEPLLRLVIAGHLQALRTFIGNLVDQAERACGCDCHKPPSLLLVGPPGAGKTYLVKQMGNVCEMPLYGVHTHQVHTASAVTKLFDQARENYPSLVFMDDVEAIFSNHDEHPACSTSVQSIRDELFAQLGSRKLKIEDPKSSKNPTNSILNSGGGRGAANGVNGSRASSRASSVHSKPRPSAPPDDDEDSFLEDESSYPDNNGIIVVAATSAPWLLYKDHELLSRFRGVYLVGLPDKQTRYNLLKTLFQDVHHNLTDQELMVVAEKTEGFTPADLMVVVKTLTYRQFSFLLSMTAHGGSVRSSSEIGSSGSQTPLSSEISETGSESDLDGLPESEGHLKRGVVSATAIAEAMAAAAASGAVPKKDIRPTPSGLDKRTLPTAANKPLTVLSNDWDSESEEEVEARNAQDMLENKSEKIKNKDSRLPTRVLEDSILCTPSSVEGKKSPRDGICVPSPDSAIGMSKGSDDFVESKISDRLEKSSESFRTPSESSSSGVTSSGCDSSDSSAIVDDRVPETRSPPPVSSDSETEATVATVTSSSAHCERTKEKAIVESSQEIKAEMDSPKNEEVENSDSALEREVDEINNSSETKAPGVEEEDRSVGTPVEFELHYSEPPEPMRNDNCAIDSDSDNEVAETPRSRGRRVAFSGMSAMEPLSVDVGDDCGPPNVSLNDLPPNISLATSNPIDSLLNDNRHQESASSSILLSLLSRPSPSRSDRRERNHSLNEATDLASFLHPDPDLDGNKTSTPIEPLGTLTPTPNLTPTPTPTPSEGSSHNGTVGSSGSGTHASAGSTSSEVHKKDDSDSSFDHSDGHTVPSSDISTATCNETGETMECRTDSDERLQDLGESHDHPNSARGSETKAMAAGGLNSLLNLESLNNIAIQVITLAEVLEVVASGYRSVSDEEIKRYTDFMVWFSNVAKSACPHSKDGSRKANAPPLDDISLDSTVYDTPSIIKKRKGPLRKLGRFLLKALMFILD